MTARNRILLGLVGLISFLALVACSPVPDIDPSGTYQVEGGQLDIRSSRGWCSPGSGLTATTSDGSVAVEQVELGVETITIGGKEVETCHTTYELEDSHVDTWTSEDRQYERTLIEKPESKGLVDKWKENGRDCFHVKTTYVAASPSASDVVEEEGPFCV